mmetsp:Transcript_57197/g.150528  ORF Transcript_57197/g.150528 Transcript_57197/m.150528 type:complete len:276 (-) Transcript_57197:254-1081(-)
MGGGLLAVLRGRRRRLAGRLLASAAVCGRERHGSHPVGPAARRGRRPGSPRDVQGLLVLLRGPAGRDPVPRRPLRPRRHGHREGHREDRHGPLEDGRLHRGGVRLRVGLHLPRPGDAAGESYRPDDGHHPPAGGLRDERGPPDPPPEGLPRAAAQRVLARRVRHEGVLRGPLHSGQLRTIARRPVQRAVARHGPGGEHRGVQRPDRARSVGGDVPHGPRRVLPDLPGHRLPGGRHPPARVEVLLVRARMDRGALRPQGGAHHHPDYRPLDSVDLP